jgi:hypothetical protein
MPLKRITQTPDEMIAHCATGILIAAPHVVALMMYRLRLLDLVVTGLSIEPMNEVQVIDQHSSRIHQDRLIQITEGWIQPPDSSKQNPILAAWILRLHQCLRPAQIFLLDPVIETSGLAGIRHHRHARIEDLMVLAHPHQRSSHQLGLQVAIQGVQHLVNLIKHHLLKDLHLAHL